MSTATKLDIESTIESGDTRPAFVLLGGVPGAGKSTLLAATAKTMPGARTLDTETHRRWLAAALPQQVPYRSYRAAVHVLHAIATFTMIMLGPAVGRALVVHNPATRPTRRDFLARLAQLRGWRPVLVVIDVSRDVALAGQRRRGRIVDPVSFDRHWTRWTEQREELAVAACRRGPMGAWDRIHFVHRSTAPDLIRDLLN